MSDLQNWFAEAIKMHKQRSTDYSLCFDDRKFSERAVKSYTSRLNKLKKGLI